MSNYVKATNFAVKDTLNTGDTNKVVRGTEIDTEFTAIASAVASKADSDSPTFTGTPLAPTASTATENTQIATTAYVNSKITARLTGTVAIDISGNAATATSATSATSATTATKLSTASGSAPSYSARAWVNFRGSSTVSIRASGNVSSITDNGTGDYTVNFTTSMSDGNYAASLYSDGSSGAGQMQRISQSTSSIRVGTGDREYATLVDGVNNFISIFR